MSWIALDIGGANVKAADGRAWAGSYPFALWKNPGGLAATVQDILIQSPPADRLAITMTGELADCFESKSAGVRFILGAAVQAAAGRQVLVYLVDGRLVPPEVAAEASLLAAASNWHALAAYAGRFVPQGGALLIDVGSTTCDVIPLVEGKPAAAGRTDLARLLAGELVYTGVVRSPVCAVAREVSYRGQKCPLAQELFATMQDVYLVLGKLPDQPAAVGADGRPATKSHAIIRLARMLAADTTEFAAADAVDLAQSVATEQAMLVAAAIAKVAASMPTPPRAVILSGKGEFLALAALRRARLELPLVSLAQELGPALSQVGPAHALAVLAREAAER
jgi:hypothetical protein